MADAPDLDAALAAFERQRAVVERAIEACRAEQALGRIGYATFTVARAERDRLLTMATSLQHRIEKALETL